MQHPPFAGGHGWKGERLSTFTHVSNGFFSGALQIPATIGFESFRVEENAVVLIRFQMENLGGDVLDCVKKFSVALGEQWSIGAR